MNKDQIKTFFMQVNEKRNNFALVSATLTLVAMFMPFATISLWGFSESKSFISAGDADIFMVLLVIASVLYFLKRDGLACIVSIPLACMALYYCAKMSELSSEVYGAVKQNIGCYLLILGSILMVAAPFIGAKVEIFIKSNVNSNTNN
ncbi:hypothetical protein [Intestinibacter bartlettii]|uniref:Uncharacterized protein n=1 Tax=Intestinibacter bartlettii TaxID=261299 RepID=A0ABS6DW59_9FIRM|nr:hypothetical protein [Intestinibacter bartlettii]MBU5335492.1 hypothetical protein [Intestinibacter bartlettii]